MQQPRHQPAPSPPCAPHGRQVVERSLARSQQQQSGGRAVDHPRYMSTAALGEPLGGGATATDSSDSAAAAVRAFGEEDDPR